MDLPVTPNLVYLVIQEFLAIPEIQVFQVTLEFLMTLDNYLGNLMMQMNPGIQVSPELLESLEILVSLGSQMILESLEILVSLGSQMILEILVSPELLVSLEILVILDILV